MFGEDGGPVVNEGPVPVLLAVLLASGPPIGPCGAHRIGITASWNRSRGPGHREYPEYPELGAAPPPRTNRNTSTFTRCLSCCHLAIWPGARHEVRRSDGDRARIPAERGGPERQRGARESIQRWIARVAKRCPDPAQTTGTLGQPSHECNGKPARSTYRIS